MIYVNLFCKTKIQKSSNKSSYWFILSPFLWFDSFLGGNTGDFNRDLPCEKDCAIAECYAFYRPIV